MSSPPLRSALYVDFDNLYSSLARRSREAARRFARDPSAWVEWLQRPAPDASPGTSPARRLLVRRCYLNPQRYEAHRPALLRAAFEVVDCPPLTRHGKTSADMRMVLDILDALGHATHFDEFVLFSGDADFTPVLLRLRKHDRRTAVLSLGPASGAYRAASDLLLPEGRFLREALGLDPDQVPELSPAAAPGAVTGTETGAVGRSTPRAATVEGGTARAGSAEPAGTATNDAVVAGAAAPAAGAGAAARAAGVDGEDLARFVREQGAESPEPVVLATLAHRIVDHFGEGVQDLWQGAGSFRTLLESLDLGPLRVSGAVPGHLYLPERHGELGPLEERDRFAEADPEGAALARRIHLQTGTPYLSPALFAVVLEEIARAVHRDGLQVTPTSRAVRDRVRERGHAVARADVAFLVKGLAFAGYEPAPEGETGHSIGRQVVRNTLELAHRNGLELDAAAEARVREWLLGGLAAPQPATAEEGAAESEDDGDSGATGAARGAR